MHRRFSWLALAFALAFPGIATADPIAILAGENFYGEAAAAIGGDRVAVTSVLIAPGTDPHDFEPSPSVAAGVSDARIVILNGADYDHWLVHLLDATDNSDRIVINVAALIGIEDGQNPHIWYDPKAMPALANALTEQLISIDPEGAADYTAGRDAFLATLAPIAGRVAELRDQFAGTPVAATEPVFGTMADAIGLKMQNESFQVAIMNEVEPAASYLAAMEDDLREGRVKVLFYNAQVEDAFTRNLAAIAAEAGVPIVGVTETQPAGKSYAEWMLDAVEATAKALSDKAS